MINFIIPGVYEHYELNMRLLDLKITNPEFFIDNCQIISAYGNFQFCIFDGGRTFNGYRQTTKEEIEEIVKTYNDYNVAVRLVFTNPNIQETSFKNRFGQTILNACHNPLNEIVVNDKAFELYLRKNYPQFSFISSTTKCLNTPQQFLEELNNKEYSMICLDYNLNHNQKLLDSISEEERHRCEFLINAICPAGCPYRKEHYRLNGLFSLTYGKDYHMPFCPIISDTLDPVLNQVGNHITPQEVIEYEKKGFINFKIEGRTLGVLENACNYVKYMIKPEYQFTALNYLINENVQYKLSNNRNTTIISY